MGSTELKTDSSQRWMMYSKDSYGSGRMFLSAEQKQAVEDGKQFAQRAYADVWAKDAALVRRVRSFLGTNFHWHQRLANNGADLEVIQTLQSMIRGESVMLVAEQSRSGGAAASATPAQPKLPSFRESLMADYGMTYDAATEYIERYNIAADRINAALDRSASKAIWSLADAGGDVPTALGNAQPFEYGGDDLGPSGDDMQTAWLPSTAGPPNQWVENASGKQQWRLYDSKGNAAVDIDFGHDHGFGAPHSHNWVSGVRDNGNAFSLLPY